MPGMHLVLWTSSLAPGPGLTQVQMQAELGRTSQPGLLVEHLVCIAAEKLPMSLKGAEVSLEETTG